MLPTSSTILAAAAAIFMIPAANAADPIVAALDRFQRFNPSGFAAALAARLPPLLPPTVVAQVVAELPKAGEVKRVSASSQHKLDAIAAVLRVYHRDGAYRVVVVETPEARVALHARFVLLVSDAALRVLSPVQLQAIVAHEIGHEYVWEEYETAKKAGKSTKIRELELFCDGFSMITMTQIGVAPAVLIDALRMLDASNRAKGLETDASRQSAGTYPSLAERAKFAREIGKWLAEGVARFVGMVEPDVRIGERQFPEERDRQE